MERLITDSEWLATLRELVMNPGWSHLFVQGNASDKHAPLTIINENSTWQYVVERTLDDKLAANTYYNGKLFSTQTYTYIEKA
jgi:hypothetical protein